MKKIIFFLLVLIFLIFSEFAQEIDHSIPTGSPDAQRLNAAFPVKLHPEGSK